MSARATASLAVALTVLSGASCIATRAEKPASTVPFFDAKTRQTAYAGPGREEPAPSEIDEVRIAYFGPDDPAHPIGGDMWRAAGIAIDRANAEGGYEGIPFRLVPVWSDNPWGTGVAELARTVFSGDVWTIVGSVDGASTHLAEQVVAKARLTLINPSSTDKTVNLANVAWMFSCLPSDAALATALAPVIVHRSGRRPFALLSATDHDSHHASSELRAELSRLGRAPLYMLEFEPGTDDYSAILQQIAAPALGSVVVVAGPADSGRAVAALRRAFPGLPVFGSRSMGRHAFIDLAGPAAEGVVHPATCDREAIAAAFAAEFAALTGRRPDCVAARTYDATRLAIEAIRLAGLNRARIRDAVQELSPWDGVGGTIEWSSLGQNQRGVRIVTVEVSDHADAEVP